MKFAEHLGAHITPEWRKQYIQYEEMKAMLYESIQEAPSSEVVEPEVLTRYFAKFDEAFFTFCEKELTKINTFYSEKLAEATRKFAALNSELSCQYDHNPKNDIKFLPLKKQSKPKEDKLPPRKLQDLKLAFSEYYLSLVLLQNYQNLNFTGFRKILKKHDKNMNTDTGVKWRSEHVDSAMFYTNKDIDKLIQDTENAFIQDLEAGDRQKAMKRLRVPPLGDKQSPWTTFKVGLFSGAFVVLVIAVVLSVIFYESSGSTTGMSTVPPKPGMQNDDNGKPYNDWRIVVRLYRGPLLVIIFMFLMGINVYGWRTSGVNHVLIFELDPRNHLSEQHLMELAAILGVIWTLSVLTFLYSDHLSIPAYANPLALVLIMIVFMFNPTKTFRHEARFWMLRVLGRIICAPFFYVGFADFWVADQLNSLAPALSDFHYLICFYTTNATLNGEWNYAENAEICVRPSNWIRPVVSCLPAWFRFAQCLRRYRDTREAFPHLINAGKYSTTFFVVIFSTLNALVVSNSIPSAGGEGQSVTSTSGIPSNSEDNEPAVDPDRYSPFFYLWILCSITSSLYAYTWDIKMDWGLLDRNAGENKFLREEIVYSSKSYYYFAIVEDFILRFGWAVSLSLTEMGFSIWGDLITSILSPLEVFRRFIWNFFRLENEHLNNCGQFRAVRDISVAPIDASDQAQIIRMMDEEDGVIAVRKAKKNVSNSASSNATANFANAISGASSTFSGGGGILKQGAAVMGSSSNAKKKGQSEMLRPLLESHGKVSLIAAPTAART